MKRIIGAVALAAIMAVPGAGHADVVAVDFEAPGYALGTVHGQDGWSSLGSIGSGCAPYDVAVVDASSYPYDNLGAQSLRLSNAVTSGCFGDQTFSKATADEAGEADADAGGMSAGTRMSYFEAGWSFASADPSSEQPGLSVVASPDRGDGARMSWIQMADGPDGLSVNFYGYDSTLGGTCSDLTNFVFTTVATGLDRAVAHSIIVEMFLLDGANNDVVRLFVDGELVHEGKSWEDYFRLCQPVNGTDAVSRTVDSVLFRLGGTSAPAHAGKGLLIDNFSASTRLMTTSLTTEPVIQLGRIPELEMAATLRSELGAPLAGKNVLFRTPTETLCEATTDAAGRASCEALGSAVQIVQTQGYLAEFVGDDIYSGTVQRGGLIGL